MLWRLILFYLYIDPNYIYRTSTLEKGYVKEIYDPPESVGGYIETLDDQNGNNARFTSELCKAIKNYATDKIKEDQIYHPFRKF